MNHQTALWGLLYVNGILLASIAGVFWVGIDYANASDSSENMGTVLPAQDESSKILQTLAPYTPSKQEYDTALRNISSYATDAIHLQYVKPNEERTHIIESDILQTFYTTELFATDLNIVIDTKKLEDEISRIALEFNKKSEYDFEGSHYTSIDRNLNESHLKRALMDELISRTHGTVRTIIVITSYVDEFPATNGDISNKYIEVDKSQQKLYLWEGGNLVSSHIISTGLIGPTPNGTHRIINHAKNAWSPIANVWTPYWMAFAYNSDAKAWLGFHELPYWDGENGEIVRRPFDTLGKPATGGCIQLNIGDAQKVFDWAQNSTIVLIHD